MNRKEIAEIRRLFSPEYCPITRIAGCYVDADRGKHILPSRPFLTLPEEEMFKYFAILKKLFSGKIGKTIHNISFEETEASQTCREFLLSNIVRERLKSSEEIEWFYDSIIESYETSDSYCILMIHGAYDIPRGTKDGIALEDASEDVYEFVLCAICPAKLAKPGLSFDLEDNEIRERIRDWLIEAPAAGFLYPAFNDRNQDTESVMYYTKRQSDRDDKFIRNVLQCEIGKSASEQKEEFAEIVQETLAENCTFENVKGIYQELDEILEEQKCTLEDNMLEPDFIQKKLNENGAKAYAKEIEARLGAGVFASNIADGKKIEIKTDIATIQVQPEAIDSVKIRTVDGKQYLIIPALDMAVNGIKLTKVEQ